MSDEKNNDKKIRESFFKKDKDFNEAIKQEMEEQESMLKGYFKEYKKPVQEDPSIMKRETREDRAILAKELLSPFRVFGSFYDEYWTKECPTPQENYVLNLCKQNTKKQMTIGITGSLTLTTLMSYQMRMSIGPGVHFMSFVVGLTGGIIYGIINSTQYSLEKFEQLGENYSLGRSSLLEIQKYRMDKHS